MTRFPDTILYADEVDLPHRFGAEQSLGPVTEKGRLRHGARKRSSPITIAVSQGSP